MYKCNLTHWQQLALQTFQQSAKQFELTASAPQHEVDANGCQRIYAARPFHYQGQKALLWLGANEEHSSTVIGPEHRMVLILLFEINQPQRAQAMAQAFAQNRQHYRSPYFFGLRANANRVGDIPLKLGTELEPHFCQAAKSIMAKPGYIALALIGNQLPINAELTCNAISEYTLQVSPIIERFCQQAKGQLPHPSMSMA